MEAVERKESARPPASDTLSRYRLVAELAQGGMGVVYLAINRGKSGFHKLLVVKELKPELARDPQFLNMFLDEARLAARLSHPNVVQTLEVGEEGDRHYLVMEYLDGQPLQRALSRISRQRFPLDLHVKVLCDMLAGLQYAHDLADYDGRPLHVVHRDVSPQNVFLTYDGQVKLVDFGIAKAMDATHETRAGMLKGKIGYMPIEQARGRAVDRRTDIYSVGVMLWEAIAGRRMWGPEMSDIAILTAVIGHELPSLASVAPEAPTELVRICQKALALDANDRYVTAEDMRSELEAYLHSQGRVPTAKALAELLAGSFSQERGRMRGLIDARIRSMEGEEEARGAMPLLHLSPGDDAEPRSGGGSTRSNPISGRMSVSSLGGGALTPMVPVPKPSSPMRVIAAGLGVAALLSVGAVITLLALRQPLRPEAAAQANAATNAVTHSDVVVTSTPRPAGATTVQLAVTATPPEAKVYVDGILVQGNPFSGGYPLDRAHHRVTVEASGYDTQQTDVVFDRDMNVSVALQKRRPTPAAAPPPPPRPRSAPTPQAPDERPATPSAPVKTSEPEVRRPGRPNRSLSGENPYGQ